MFCSMTMVKTICITKHARITFENANISINIIFVLYSNYLIFLSNFFKNSHIRSTEDMLKLSSGV